MNWVEQLYALADKHNLSVAELTKHTFRVGVTPSLYGVGRPAVVLSKQPVLNGATHVRLDASGQVTLEQVRALMAFAEEGVEHLGWRTG